MLETSLTDWDLFMDIRMCIYVFKSKLKFCTGIYTNL